MKTTGYRCFQNGRSVSVKELLEMKMLSGVGRADPPCWGWPCCGGSALPCPQQGQLQGAPSSGLLQLPACAVRETPALNPLRTVPSPGPPSLHCYPELLPHLFPSWGFLFHQKMFCRVKPLNPHILQKSSINKNKRLSPDPLVSDPVPAAKAHKDL